MAAKKKSYWELLKDPRWQRKRLEVMQRASFKCEQCDDDGTTLNVHHAYYRKDAMPWDYPDDCFKCLCQPCHERFHGLKQRVVELLGRTPDLERVLGYLTAECCMDEQPIDIEDEMFGWGFSDRLGIPYTLMFQFWDEPKSPFTEPAIGYYANPKIFWLRVLSHDLNDWQLGQLIAQAKSMLKPLCMQDQNDAAFAFNGI